MDPAMKRATITVIRNLTILFPTQTGLIPDETGLIPE